MLLWKKHVKLHNANYIAKTNYLKQPWLWKDGLETKLKYSQVCTHTHPGQRVWSLRALLATCSRQHSKTKARPTVDIRSNRDLKSSSCITLSTKTTLKQAMKIHALEIAETQLHLKYSIDVLTPTLSQRVQSWLQCRPPCRVWNKLG